MSLVNALASQRCASLWKIETTSVVSSSPPALRSFARGKRLLSFLIHGGAYVDKPVPASEGQL